MRIMLGLGCDRNTPFATVQATFAQGLAIVGLEAGAVAGVATIDKKNDEIAILQLAARNGWLLHFFTAEQLAQVKVPNPSEVVRKHMGTPAVSEAAAMLAAGVEMNGLLLEKHKYRGEDGKNATVSIARMNED
jgi:cobalt-precorrin 5A hydrolase